MIEWVRSRPSWAWHLVSIAVIAGLTWFEWGWIAFERGFHAETNWMIYARAESLPDTFLYSDPSRPFLQLPFGFAHLLSPDSMAAANWVIAGYVLAMALLAYWFAYRLLGDSIPGGLVAASVALTFGADQASALFSMVILWQVMIGVLVTALALRASMLGRLTGPRCIAIVAGAALALWTYEASALPLLALAFLPLALPSRNWRRIGIALMPLAGVLVVFAAMTLSRAQTGVSYYQANKLTGVPSVDEAWTRMTTWLGHALQPWIWGDPWTLGWFRSCLDAGRQILTAPVVIAAAAWAVIAVLVALGTRGGGRAGTAGTTLRVGAFAIVLICASYVPYLMVSDGAGHWRTHMMAQPGWGLLVGALVVTALRVSLAGGAVLVAACGALVGFGLWGSLWGQLENAARWDTVRTVMSGVTRVAPGLRPGTTVVLTGVGEPVNNLCRAAPAADPFGDPSWFNSALSLYYPDDVIGGTYIRREGLPPTGVRLTAGGVAVGNATSPWKDVVVIHLDRNARAQLVPPDQLGRPAPGYDPSALTVPADGRGADIRGAFTLTPSQLP